MHSIKQNTVIPNLNSIQDYLEYEVNENELLSREVDLVVRIDQRMSLPKKRMHELLPKDKLTCMVADNHPI